jgi:hypothetical protein
LQLHERSLPWFCNKCKAILVFVLFPAVGQLNKVDSTSTLKGNDMRSPIDEAVDRAGAYGALHDAARRRAQELRREAMGDFWRGADAAWAAMLSTAQRSAQRLGYRLARHARARAMDHAAPCCTNDRT